MNYKQYFEQHSTRPNPAKYGFVPNVAQTMSAVEYQEQIKRDKAMPSTVADTREEERYQAFKGRLIAENILM